MKRLALLAACAAVLACSSGQKVKVIRPEIGLVQLVGPADLNYPTGDIEVQYAMRIANRSSEAITLRRIELSPVGGGGPYTLRRESYYFTREVGPDQFLDLAFWAKAYAEGNRMAGDATAPVTIRATAFFDSPSGAFREVFLRTFQQYGSDHKGRN
ncbi:MAG TPA: hypothetical protein VGF48_18880 [Thermoanaerobaculia bacterium]